MRHKLELMKEGTRKQNDNLENYVSEVFYKADIVYTWIRQVITTCPGLFSYSRLAFLTMLPNC